MFISSMCCNLGIKYLPSHWLPQCYSFRETISYHSNSMTSLRNAIFILALSTYISKTARWVKPIFYYRQDKMQLLTTVKIHRWGSEPPDVFENFRWLWTLWIYQPYSHKGYSIQIVCYDFVSYIMLIILIPGKRASCNWRSKRSWRGDWK